MALSNSSSLMFRLVEISVSSYLPPTKFQDVYLLFPVEESCNELFIRLKSLICSCKATHADSANSDDETRARALLPLLKTISGLMISSRTIGKVDPRAPLYS